MDKDGAKVAVKGWCARCTCEGRLYAAEHLTCPGPCSALSTSISTAFFRQMEYTHMRTTPLAVTWCLMHGMFGGMWECCYGNLPGSPPALQRQAYVKNCRGSHGIHIYSNMHFEYNSTECTTVLKIITMVFRLKTCTYAGHCCSIIIQQGMQ